MEKLLKSSENILPFVLWILGIFIISKFSLSEYAPQIMPEKTIFLAILELGNIKKDIINLENNAVFRFVFGAIITSIMIIYYYALPSMTFAISLFLMVNIIGYMCIISGTINIPSITELCGYGLTLAMWYVLFFLKRNIYTFINSCILMALLGIIDPIFAISIICAVILSTIICAIVDNSKETHFYHLLLIVMCGFIGASFSLIITSNIHEFTSLLLSHYQKGVCVSMFLTLLTATYYSSLGDLIPHSTGLMPKNCALIISTFVSAVAIGRLDYIYHFLQ